MSQVALQQPAEPSSFRLVLTLGLAGLISGLALVFTYETTLPQIERNKAEALRRAVFHVLPGAKEMKKLVVEGNGLVAVSADDKREGVYAGYDSSKQLVGYAVVGEGPGFQDTIRLIYGYDPRRKLIIGMEVLESRETPGLGDKIFKDKHFVAGFSALAVNPQVEAVKSGSKSKPNQIDAITGATISSKAVVKIVNTANKQWQSYLDGAKQ